MVKIFGEGKNLSALQMSARGIAVFFIALILIRISGRRSFGIRTPLDNIVVVMLGALLSRAIVGASAFIPVVAVSFITVVLHRLLGSLIAHSKWAGKVIEGNKIPLFKDDNFLRKNMNKALVCEEDVLQGVRKSVLTEDLHKIKAIYMERNGEISAIKKEVETK